MKLHVIGEPDAVLGFLLVGFTGQVATTPVEVKEALEAASKDSGIGVIFVTEMAASLAQDMMDTIRLSSTGAIVVEIPGPGGPVEGRPSLHDAITRATGVRV